MTWLAFGTTFRVTGGYRKGRTIFLKRVTGRVFSIVSENTFNSGDVSKAASEFFPVYST
jgi:hypothetical protein